MTEAVVTLPFPTSANALWRNVAGRTLKSAPYRAWLKAAMAECWGVKRVAGPYHLTVIADRPDRRRRDLSNILKATEDLLTQAGIIEDDHLAQSILMKWSEAAPVSPARVRVSVRPA